MNFNISITKRVDTRDSSNKLISRAIGFTVTVGTYTHAGCVSLAGDEVLLTVAEQKALVKDKIKTYLLGIKAALADQKTQTEDTTWNQTFQETVV